jgi:hypothetical protein
MNESKIQQRSRERGKNIRLGLLVFVLLIISPAILLLNSQGVQRSLWGSFVEPRLENIGLSSEFQGFTYKFPNSIEFNPLLFYTEFDTLVTSEKIELAELSFSKGWRLTSFESLGLEINVPAVRTFISKQEAKTSSQGFRLSINELSVPSLKLMGDTLLSEFQLNCSGLQFDETLSIDSIVFKAQWDSIPFLVCGHQIGYDEAAISGLFELDVLNFGQLKGAISGELEDLNVEALLRLDANSQILPAEFEEYDLPLVYNVEFFCHEFDSIKTSFAFKSPTIGGKLSCTGRLKQQLAVELNLDVLTVPDKYLPEEIPLSLVPNRLNVSGRISDWEIYDIRAVSTSEKASYRLNFSDLESPAYISASVHETNFKSLESLEFRTAIRPNMSSVFTEDWNATGVFPKLQFSTHTTKGLSFDLYHDGIKDSVWLSCLDTLLDLEGFVLKNGEDYTSALDLNAVGLDLFDPLDTGQVISGAFKVDFKSSSIGKIEAIEVLLERPNDSVFLHSLVAEHSLKKGIRTLVIQSDVADGKLQGDWEFQSLPKIVDVLIASSYNDNTVKMWPKAEMEGYLKVGEVNWFADLMHLPLTIEPGSAIQWEYTNFKKQWSLEGFIPSCAYGEYTLEGLDLNINHNGSDFNAKASLDHILINQTAIHSLKAESYGSGISREVQFIATVKDSIPSVVTGALNYTSGSATLVKTSFNIGLDTFAISKSKRIHWDAKSLITKDLEFKGDAGSLLVNGRFSFLKPLKHQANIKANLNARPLNYLIRTPEAILGGTYSIDMAFHDDTIVNWFAMASVTDLSLNNISYGTFTGAVGYEPLKSDVFIQGQLSDEEQFYSLIRGHYNTAIDDLDLSLNIDKLNVAALNPFFHEAIAGLEGNLVGGVQIYGPLKSWNARGEVYWNKGAVEIPLLGSRFSAAEQSLISISENGFELDSIALISMDDQTKSLTWGGIEHHQLKDFGLDLRLSTDSLLAMNKERNVEDMFYGTAVAAGEMHLIGPVEQLQLSVQATTKAGTILKIPLDNPTAVELPGFIRFIDSELPRVTTESIEGERDFFGADLAIEVTPVAKIELVLDEVLGDIIRAQGSGSMRLKILEDESVELYGVYTVEEGDYLFTLQNIINKQFNLLSGGTIAWSGDVYEAELDLKAVYRVQTDLTGLVTSANYNNEKVPVDLIISLTGPLLSPEIAFAIDLPESPASYQQELNRHFLNEEALHYQAFSLLMLGDFFQQNLGIQESINFESSIGNTTSELLVSEFGSWLAAGIGEYVTVDFDYTTGANPMANFGNQGDNLNLGVSKNFFDGKLKLKSSFDVPIGQEQASTLLLGDTEVSLDLSKQGTVVLKAFNRSNRNDPLLQTTGPYTQGVGIQFKKDFDRVTKSSKTDVQ